MSGDLNGAAAALLSCDDPELQFYLALALATAPEPCPPGTPAGEAVEFRMELTARAYELAEKLDQLYPAEDGRETHLQACDRIVQVTLACLNAGEDEEAAKISLGLLHTAAEIGAELGISLD